ncbi:MAG: proton-conducting transporter membrane subunit [Kiritimatiellaeota bacterium]|nr:proton-conducting transporter membrane subunit [Kiritimatiellota bacterium]
MTKLMYFAILLPALISLLALGTRKLGKVCGATALLGAVVNLVVAIKLFMAPAHAVHIPWTSWGLDFTLRLYPFSAFIVLAAAGFALAITLYSLPFMAKREHSGLFYFQLLLSVAFANGAALADNLILLLFFWEGLLITLYGLIAIGRPGAWKSAMKALVLVGVSDVCMMFGIALAGHYAGTMQISKMHLVLTQTGPTLAFLFLIVGATAKAGALPFHSWIPDAAVDAPLPFMALMPAAFEKLLGIYFLARITLDIFALTPGSWCSTLLMTLGAITILIAVMMALIQKDYKRLLAYHAISQVGYMILGVGTAVPAGIVGGLFHMINHAMYKSGLFLTGGSVERQAGTTDLSKLGGIARQMPITFFCFFVTACSISGVPPFNGFISKELIYDGALERGGIFYAAALLGSFLTAASFLKLGHSAYFGKRSEENKNVKEAPWAMLLPMLTIAGFCILFGVYNQLPLHSLIQPILGEHRLEGHDFAGWHFSVMLVVGTLVVLALALLNHFIGVKRSGSGIGAADHIHYAPGLHQAYDAAEKGWFDPYELGMKLARFVGYITWGVDRFINWLSDGLAVGVTAMFSYLVRAFHTGSLSIYIWWAIAGVVLVIVLLVKVN